MQHLMKYSTNNLILAEVTYSFLYKIYILKLCKGIK